MTTTPTRPTTTAPVPWAARQQFQAELARAALATSGDARRFGYDPIQPVCAAGASLANEYEWPTVDDVAAELAHHLGIGWGAIYRVWAHQGGCQCWEEWVSHSEVGRIPSRECLLHRGEVDSVV